MTWMFEWEEQMLLGVQEALRTDWLTPIMKFITLFGEAGIFWIVCCLVMIVFKRTRRLGIICSLSLAFTFIVCNLTIKPLVDRVRPWEIIEELERLIPDPGDASFPSGHSADSMGPAWAMFLATMPIRMKREDGSLGTKSYDSVRCLGWKGEGAQPRTMHMLAIAAVVLSVLIGLSRLYLGVHFPTDVICGLLLGMIVATVVYYVIIKIEDKRGVIGRLRTNEAGETK